MNSEIIEKMDEIEKELYHLLSTCNDLVNKFNNFYNILKARESALEKQLNLKEAK